MDKEKQHMVKLPYNEKWSIEYFESTEGNYPVLEFMKGIADKKMAAKILRAIDLLETIGNEIRQSHNKYLGNGIYELRIKQGSNIARVFYFYYHGKQIVLTNGYMKKENKTSHGGFVKAMKYRKEYFKRGLENE